ncbi:LOW QUALITY PROTEIN: hypothetical protein HID58_034020 [Brassica napus]|uniref:Uncharacterized protein n=1 Tax=Brassica napus TaxID=3708 RepID=A0ABQ8C0V8_BRANA|nr:LOW QUALITY PROTEIN: hypothetical protein HID58_034020 [Brassica napus]
MEKYGHMSQLRAYDSFVRTKLMVRVRHFLKQTNGELTLKWSDEIDDNSDFGMLLMNLPVTKRMKRPKSYPAADAESSKMNKLMIKAVEVEKDIIVQIKNLCEPDLQHEEDEKLITCTSIEANVSALLAPMNEKLETMEKDFQRMKEIL